jgi:hypothetical protein
METRSPELLESLERKLREAQASYLRAMQEYRRLMSTSRSTSDLNDPGFVDGQHALSKALRIHRHARVRYERRLQDFTEYVLNGTPPKDVD